MKTKKGQNMNKLFNIFIIFIVLILFSGCGWFESMYDEGNYESITNDAGTLTLWSGGKIMAIFHEMTVIYSAADSDALYFKDKKHSVITLRGSNGELYTIEGNGDTWYNSPGVLIKLED